MKSHRGVDYHGSRSYDADKPVVGRMRLMIAWFAAILRGRLRRSIAHAAPPAFSDAEGGYSLLGTINTRSASLRTRVPVQVRTRNGN